MQGNCTKPPPARERRAPLTGYREGQCLLDSSVAHFMFIADAIPAQVWLDNLYLYAEDSEHSIEPLISDWPSLGLELVADACNNAGRRERALQQRHHAHTLQVRGTLRVA